MDRPDSTTGPIERKMQRELESSLVRLEQKVEDLGRRQIEDREGIKAIRESVQRIEVRMATFRPCEAPNLCLALQPEVERFKQFLDQAKGVGKAVRFVWMFAAATFGSIMTLLVQRVIERIIP